LVRVVQVLRLNLIYQLVRHLRGHLVNRVDLVGRGVRLDTVCMVVG